MKKSNWLCGIAYVVAGIIFLLIGIFTDTKLDSLMFGFAGAGIIPGMVMIYKYFYWNSPNNVERYKEKLEAENIELHDELKNEVRGMTARYVYVFGLCIISASIVLFTELVREPFQQLLWLVLCERFRQSDNQFPCFDTLSLCSASLKFLLAFPCKVAPKGIISGTVGGVKVLLP